MTFPARYPRESITHIIVPRWVLARLMVRLSGPGYIWCNDRGLEIEFLDEIADSSGPQGFPCGNMLKTAMVLSNYMALI